jgi:hypothetical protein
VIVGTDSGESGYTGLVWLDEVVHSAEALLIANGLFSGVVAGWNLDFVTDVSADGLRIVGTATNPAGRLEAFVADLTPGPSDSDGDDVGDAHDNCFRALNASQLDADGDGYGNACDGDLDNSGMVNFADLALFRAAFGRSNAVADLDASGGTVNFADLARLRQLFGLPPGPSGLHP